MSFPEIGYWASTVLVCMCAVLPYFWNRLFGYGFNSVSVDSSIAALWILCFVATIYLAKIIGKRWWWAAVTGPFALFKAGEHPLTFLFWTLFGLAP